MSQDAIKEKLRELNQWDIKLYDFAMSLVAWRLKHIVPIIRKLRGHVHVHGVHGNSNTQPDTESVVASWKDRDQQLAAERHMCDGFQEDIKAFQHKFQGEFGIFRPEGHKGP